MQDGPCGPKSGHGQYLIDATSEQIAIIIVLGIVLLLPAASSTTFWQLCLHVGHQMMHAGFHDVGN